MKTSGRIINRNSCSRRAERREATSSKTPAYIGQRGSTPGNMGPTRRAHHFSCEITDIFEFMQPFDMRNFPFDTQGLELRFESPPVEMPNYNPCTFGARLSGPSP